MNVEKLTCFHFRNYKNSCLSHLYHMFVSNKSIGQYDHAWVQRILCSGNGGV